MAFISKFIWKADTLFKILPVRILKYLEEELNLRKIVLFRHFDGSLSYPIPTTIIILKTVVRIRIRHFFIGSGSYLQRRMYSIIFILGKINKNKQFQVSSQHFHVQFIGLKNLVVCKQI